MMLLINVLSAVMLLIISGYRLTLFFQGKDKLGFLSASVLTLIAFYFIVSSLGIVKYCP